jgi:adenylosuccinate lyase
MLENIYLTNGVIFAQRVLTKLIDAGVSREEAYDTVQPIAMKAWKEGISYKDLLLGNDFVMGYLSNDDIEDAFEIDYFLRNVDLIFKRVGL